MSEAEKLISPCAVVILNCAAGSARLAVMTTPFSIMGAFEPELTRVESFHVDLLSVVSLPAKRHPWIAAIVAPVTVTLPSHTVAALSPTPRTTRKEVPEGISAAGTGAAAGRYWE